MGVLGKNRTKQQKKRYDELFKIKRSNNRFKKVTQDVKKDEGAGAERKEADENRAEV